MPHATKMGALSEAAVGPSVRLSVCPMTLGQNGAFLSHHMVVWEISLMCVILFVTLFLCFFVRLRISQRRKKATGVKFCVRWPTIRTGLLPF